MGRYFADGTYAKESLNRYYALRKGTNYPFKLREWIRFLQMWSIRDLDNGARIIRAQTAKDLGDEELKLIQRLREWAGILYLKKDDPLSAYQNQLRTLHKLGILNLHLPSPAWEREEELLVC